ncbi:14768_t:CDS:1, partial [Dentiscutata erythropus]
IKNDPTVRTRTLTTEEPQVLASPNKIWISYVSVTAWECSKHRLNHVFLIVSPYNERIRNREIGRFSNYLYCDQPCITPDY